MTRAIAARLAAAVLAAAILSSCSPVDGGQARLCRTVLAGLEPDGAVRILSESVDPVARFGVRLAYEVTPETGAERLGVLRCAFGGGRLDDRRLDLRAVEVDGERLGEAQLLLLERFWLADPEATRAAEARIDRPDRTPLVPVTLSPWAGYLLQQIVNAAPVGAFYALIAMAYAFVYGLVGRINLAFGEVAVIGAFAMINVLMVVAAAAAGLSPGLAFGAVAVAVAAAGLAAGAAGAAMERMVFRPLAAAGTRAFLIATVGLAIALGEMLRLLAGSAERWIQPFLNEPRRLVAGPYPVTATPMQAVEIAGFLAAAGLIALMMTRSRFGRDWRAVADDPLMARLVGIDPARVAAITFVVSSALAGVAGGLSALHYGHASPYSGLLIGIKALVAAVLGGIGSIPGAALGGFAIGLVETLWSAYLPLAHRDIAVLSILVLVLVFRPSGLFGLGRGQPGADERRRLGFG